MPFKIIKVPKGYQLEKNDGKRVNIIFKTKQSAINQGINFMRFRGEEGVLRGGKLVKK